MEGTRFGAYLGEADGQFVATLRHVAAQAGLDLARPWRDLGSAERQLAMHGTGETVHEVAWRYRRGKVEGLHALRTPWLGFANLVDREYERIHADPKGEELEALLVDLPCAACGGERLREGSRAVRFGGRRLPEVMALSISEVPQLVRVAGEPWPFSPGARPHGGASAGYPRAPAGACGGRT